MAVDVDRDGADRAIFDLVVEPARGQSASSSWRRRSGTSNQSFVDLLEALVARELVGAVAGQEDVRAVLQQPRARG